MKKLFTIALIAIGIWGYNISNDGGDPVKEISEKLAEAGSTLMGIGVWGYNVYSEGGSPIQEFSKTMGQVGSDFKRGFQKGIRESLEQEAAERLELPRLSKASGQYFVVHEVNGEVNYSLEYDADKRHSRWVAFTFDNRNSRDVVGRMDTWSWDPKLPQRLTTENLFKGSGYSRGHLVASEDRVANKEANMQTFYYSNISPQLQVHNAGIWKKLEEKVRSWGRNSRMRKIIYVAKGGTIADDQIKKQRVANLVVIPKYYWMALLAEDLEGKYHAIAFLTEHRAYQRSESNLARLALSVDELEIFTGLDFFHNLDDSIENAVEAESPIGKDARHYWWR